MARTSPRAALRRFHGGTNEGASYNPGDVIETSGGNPGGWWHQATADTFGPIITSTIPSLAGDWRERNVDLASFDARLDDLDFGTGAGFQMTLLLRDTHGTPGISDDDFAYFVGENVPLKGAGWSPSPIRPEPGHVRPAGRLDRRLSRRLDELPARRGLERRDHERRPRRVWWIDPQLFAIFQRGTSVSTTCTSAPTARRSVRNGSGVNPLGYASTSAPTLGATWTATVDLATPGHLLSAVAVSFGGATEGIFPGGAITGELLVLPASSSTCRPAATHWRFPRPSPCSACASRPRPRPWRATARSTSTTRST